MQSASKPSTKSRATTKLLDRDIYGALSISAHLSAPQRADLKALLAKAVAEKGGIPAAYITSTKTEMECLNHDIYDVVITRGKVRGLVVQARYFWKHLRKTRSRMLKSYFLVTSSYSTVKVTELENATCVRRAKNTSKLGQLAGHYLGTTTVKCASGS